MKLLMLQQISAFFLKTHLSKFFFFLKFRIQANQKSIAVVQGFGSSQCHPYII